MCGKLYSDLGRISDIFLMQTTFTETKECVFCGEQIQTRAIKCRYCAEFLNTAEAKALEDQGNCESQADEQEEDDGIVFCGRPSLLGMAGALIRGAVFLALAAFLINYPIEEMPIFQPNATPASIDQTETAVERTEFGFSEAQLFAISQYRVMAGLGLATLVVLILLVKTLRLKMIYYEVSADRIEWSRGILDRRVDNLDMFRVIDLRLRRSLLDCIFGIGTVSLITTDKTDPEFAFEKVRHCRQLYDAIKDASLDADRKNNVVHLE